MPSSTAFPPGRMKILCFGYFCCFQAISKNLKMFQNLVRQAQIHSYKECSEILLFYLLNKRENSIYSNFCPKSGQTQMYRTGLGDASAFMGTWLGTQMCEQRSISAHFPLCNLHPSVSYFLIKHSCKMQNPPQHHSIKQFNPHD